MMHLTVILILPVFYEETKDMCHFWLHTLGEKWVLKIFFIIQQTIYCIFSPRWLKGSLRILKKKTLKIAVSCC